MNMATQVRWNGLGKIEDNHLNFNIKKGCGLRNSPHPISCYYPHGRLKHSTQDIQIGRYIILPFLICLFFMDRQVFYLSFFYEFCVTW